MRDEFCPLWIKRSRACVQRTDVEADGETVWPSCPDTRPLKKPSSFCLCAVPLQPELAQTLLVGKGTRWSSFLLRLGWEMSSPLTVAAHLRAVGRGPGGAHGPWGSMQVFLKPALRGISSIAGGLLGECRGALFFRSLLAIPALSPPRGQSLSAAGGAPVSTCFLAFLRQGQRKPRASACPALVHSQRRCVLSICYTPDEHPSCPASSERCSWGEG